MKLLLIADLHFRIDWYRWLIEQAPNYDLVWMVGDLLEGIAGSPEQIKTRRSKRRLADGLDEIAKHCASLPVLDRRSPEDVLYDDYGLPDHDY
jgi:Icc-related predicted phosphoesterase